MEGGDTLKQSDISPGVIRIQLPYGYGLELTRPDRQGDLVHIIASAGPLELMGLETLVCNRPWIIFTDYEEYGIDALALKEKLERSYFFVHRLARNGIDWEDYFNE